MRFVNVEKDLKKSMNEKRITVGLVSLGCAKNQVDAESMLGSLQQSGYRITSDPAQADVIVINTCAFIEPAREEAIAAILEMAEYKKYGRCRVLLVTGCLAQRYPEEIAEHLPEVDGILGVGGYDRILETIQSCLNGGKRIFCEMNTDLRYLNGPRILIGSSGCAYLKLSEGCDNRCAYCAIPDIRGPFRSRPMEDLLQEAERLVRTGVQELIVVAQDTSRYGKDLYGECCLPVLLRRLDRISGLNRIRLMYLYPDEVTEELIAVMKECAKIAHYVDLPIQHISNSVLSRMNRRGSADDIRRIFARFRAEMPDCVLRSTLIVGFPGETEADFEELKQFVAETKFDRLGIFTYSKEDGTPAARMSGQIKKAVKERRYHTLMKLQQQISYEKNTERIGKIYDVLVEGTAEDGIFYYGRSYGEGPDDVDGRIYFTAEEPLMPGTMVQVKILLAEAYDLTGAVILKEEI